MGRGILMVMLLNVTFCFSFAGNRSLRAEQGTIDYSTVGFADETYWLLNGEFEFYWKSLVHPDSINKSSIAAPHTFVMVPSYWANSKDLSFPEKGFATYHLKILLPDSFRQLLTFDVPVFDSSYELFLNGQSMAKNGRVGTSKHSEQPEYSPKQFDYLPDTDTLQLTVWVSNFSHHQGGFWKEIRFGPSASFKTFLSRESFFSLLTIGVLLAFALVFLLFFIGQRNDQSMIYFALILLGVALRVCVTGDYFIGDLWPISWSSIIRLEYISLVIILVSGIYFFAEFLNSKFFRWLGHGNAVICILILALILFQPVEVFSISVIYFELLIPLVLIAVVFLSVKEAWEGSLKAILNIVGILIVFVAFVNDVLVASSRLSLFDDYVAQYAVLFFALMHGAVLFYRWVEVYREKAELNNVVTYINSNLEKLVAERTDELEAKNTRIEKQNHEMSDSINLQNRLFSIIGHDLRSPLATLFQLAEVLEEDIEPEERKKIIRSLRQLSRSTGDMIDNLIYWGRSQGHELKYNPSSGFLSDVYDELADMLIPIAEQKGIDLQFEDKSKKESFFDKELIHLVIRNLIGNAIKFTPHDGNITLSVEYDNKEKCHVISIQDTGVGMSRKMIDTIISGENNKSTPGTKGEKGTGLGLVLCKDLVEMHGGKFGIESREGVGSKFFFTLPGRSRITAPIRSQKV